MPDWPMLLLMKMKNLRLLTSQPGIAIGPILFIVAILAVLAGAMSSGFGSYGVSATEDRIKTEIRGQANLIRAKIQECYMTTMGSLNFDYPSGPTPNGTLVTNLDCPGDPTGQQNIWRGARPTSLPPVPRGFGEWYYYNYNKGRCIIITPTTSGASQAGVQSGLTIVKNTFNTNEVYLDGTDKSLSIWLTPLATPVKCGS